jgi:hypothetical protein
MEESRIAQPIGSALDRFIKSNQEQFAYASGGAFTTPSGYSPGLESS